MANQGHDHHAPHAAHAPGHHAHVHHGSDKGAAFVGLIGGLIFVLAVTYGIVQWTNAKYAGHGEGGAAAAAETKH